MTSRGPPVSGLLLPAAVVLCPSFSSSTVAVGAVFSFGCVRGSESFCGCAGLFLRAALNVAAHVVAHLRGWTKE